MRIFDHNGQVTIMVMFLMILLMALGGATLSISQSLQRNAISSVREKKAYYIAEAGVNRAIAMIAAGQTDPGALVGMSYAGGIITDASCDPVINGAYTEYTVTCTGRYPDPLSNSDDSRRPFNTCTVTAQFRLEHEAREPGGGLQEGAGDYFRRGIWTDSLVLPGDCHINSDIYVSGDLKLTGGSSVGDSSRPVAVYTGGSVVMDGGASLFGDITAGGDIDFGSGESASDRLLASGDITLGANNKVGGAVFAGGNLTAAGSVCNLIQAGGSVKLSDGCIVQGRVKAGDDLSLGDEVVVHNAVWTKQDLHMGKGSRIDGDACVEGALDPSSDCLIAGGILPHQKGLLLTDFTVGAMERAPRPEDLAFYQSRADAACESQPGSLPDDHIKGDQTFNIDGSQAWNGVYYIDGDLRIAPGSSNTFTGRATFAVSGSITIPEGTNILPADESQDSLVLIAGEDINLAGENRVTAMLWAGNRIEIGPSVCLKGAMISPELSASYGFQMDQIRLDDVVTVTSWQ